MPTPSVGRDVHYVSFGTPNGEYPRVQCRAAKITEVDETASHPTVGLVVFNPTGEFFRPLCAGGSRYQDPESRMSGPEGGTWHWPERVGD